tara:strand:+ start:106915 stop:107043 length:129 start_codon:yes stop_codon:yes gene_type:complete
MIRTDEEYRNAIGSALHLSQDDWAGPLHFLQKAAETRKGAAE